MDLMDRTTYFEKISKVQSPLLLLPDSHDALYKARESDDEISLNIYLSFASELEAFNTDPAKTRAAFIRLQCQGINTEDLFNEYAESWGVPIFQEGLVTADDFKNGFLWTFRDHTTSWCEDEDARTWFYNNIEGRFARRYEYYSYDKGQEELLLIESGDFKQILGSIINKHQDYSALISPVFSKAELESFYAEYDETIYGFEKKELINIIKQNQNWQ